MNCAVTKEAQDLLQQKVIRDLLDMAKAGESLDVKAYMKRVYDLVYNKKEDELQGLDHARLVPGIINMVQSINPEIRALLKSSDVSIDGLIDQDTSFMDVDTGIDSVRDYLIPKISSAEFINKLNEVREKEDTPEVVLTPAEKNLKMAEEELAREEASEFRNEEIIDILKSNVEKLRAVVEGTPQPEKVEEEKVETTISTGPVASTKTELPIGYVIIERTHGQGTFNVRSDKHGVIAEGLFRYEDAVQAAKDHASASVIDDLYDEIYGEAWEGLSRNQASSINYEFTKALRTAIDQGRVKPEQVGDVITKAKSVAEEQGASPRITPSQEKKVIAPAVARAKRREAEALNEDNALPKKEEVSVKETKEGVDMTLNPKKDGYTYIRNSFTKMVTIVHRGGKSAGKAIAASHYMKKLAKFTLLPNILNTYFDPLLEDPQMLSDLTDATIKYYDALREIQMGDPMEYQTDEARLAGLLGGMVFKKSKDMENVTDMPKSWLAKASDKDAMTIDAFAHSLTIDFEHYGLGEDSLVIKDMIYELIQRPKREVALLAKETTIENKLIDVQDTFTALTGLALTDETIDHIIDRIDKVKNNAEQQTQEPTVPAEAADVDRKAEEVTEPEEITEPEQEPAEEPVEEKSAVEEAQPAILTAGPMKKVDKVLDAQQLHVNTFFATTAQETDEGRIPNQDMVPYFALMRSLISEISLTADHTGNDLTIGDKKGIHLSLMNRANSKLKLPPNIDPQKDPNQVVFVLVVTDDAGNPILFDPESSLPTTDSKRGIHGVYNLPSIPLASELFDKHGKIKNKKFAGRVDSLATAIKKGKNPTAEEYAQAEAHVVKEIQTINNMKEYISKNKADNSILLELNGGSMGHIDIKYGLSNRTKLSMVENDFKLHLVTAQEESATNKVLKANRTYVKAEGTSDELYGLLLEVERPTVQDSGHAQTVMQLLFDPLVDSTGQDLSWELRRKYLRAFINTTLEGSNDTTRFVKLVPDETSERGYILQVGDPKDGEPLIVDFNDEASVAAGKKMYEGLLTKKEKGRYVNFKMHFNKEFIKDGGLVEIPSIKPVTLTRDGVTITTNAVVAENMNYLEFIKKSNAEVSTTELSSDNFLRRTNPYLTFGLNEEFSLKAQEEDVAKEEEVTPEEQAAQDIEDQRIEDSKDDFDQDELDDLFNDDIELKMRMDVKSKDLKATKEQIKAAEKWYKDHPLSKHIPFKEMFHKVNSDAVATWAIDGITLYQGSDHADLYHEAWHGFSQMFMTKGEKKALYNEVRKKNGTFKDFEGKLVNFRNASDLQIEEHLAVEFRNYMLKGQKPTKGAPKQNSLFRRIWNALKALFGNRNVQEIVADQNADVVIGELFEKLRWGNLKDYSFSAQNANFGILNSGIVSFNVAEPGALTHLNHQNSKVVTDMVDHYIAEYIDIRNSEIGPEGRKELLRLREELKRKDSDYTNEMRDADQAKHDGLASKASYKYSGQITKNKELLEKAYKYTRIRMRSLKKKLEAQRDAATTDTQKASLADDIAVLQFAIDNFGDVENLDSNTPIEGEAVKNVIGYHIEKSKVFMDIKPALAYENESEDASFLKAKDGFGSGGNENSLKDLAAAEILYLIKTLPNKDKNRKEILNRFGIAELADFQATWNRITRKLQNIQDFDLMYKELKNLKEEYPVIEELVNRLGKPEDSKTLSEHTLWGKFFKTFNKSRVPLIQMTVDEFTEKGDKKYTTKVGEAFNADYAVGRRWQTNFSAALPGSEKYIANDNEGNFLNTEELLKDWDVAKATNPKHMFDFYNAIGFKLTDSRDLRRELTDINNTGDYSPLYLFRTIQKLHSEGVRIDSFDTLTKDFTGRYKKLQQLEALYSDVFTNYMVTNAEGNTQFEHSLNNSMTIMVNSVNQVKNYDELKKIPHLQHLDIDKNPFAKASWWMKSMFELDLDPTDPRYGKRREHDGVPIKLRLTNLSGVLYQGEGAAMDSGTSSASADPYTKLIMDLHMSHAGFPELMRHADKGTSFSITLDGPVKGGLATGEGYIPTASFNDKSTYELAALEYLIPHVVAEVSRIKYLKALEGSKEDFAYDHKYIKKGQNFHVFDNVLRKDTKEKLLSLAKELTDEQLLEELTRNNLDFRALLRTDISDYFQEKFEEVEQELNDNADFISDNLADTARTKGMPGVQGKQALIRAYVHNSWIHNVESLSMIYGDLAQYKEAKEEFHKRNAGAGSTGEIVRTDSIMQRYINGHVWESSYAKSLGFEQEMFTGQMKTAVVEDQDVPSAYIDEYKKVLGDKAADYGEMTEADGQGLITFDAYRQIKIAESTWTPQHDALFKEIVDGKSVDPNLVKKFFPVIKGQYWGPLQTEHIPLMGFHKYSLFPMIPSVIDGRNGGKRKTMDAVHKKMLKEGIGYLTFNSGSKVSTVTKKSGIDKLFAGDRSKRILDPRIKDLESAEPYFTPNVIHLQYFKNQLEIHDEAKGQVIFSTQLRKLVEDGLMINGAPKDFMGDTDMKDPKQVAARKKAWEALGKYKGDKLVDDTEMFRASPHYSLLRTYEENIEKLTKFHKRKLLEEIEWTSTIVNGQEVLDGSMKNLMDLVKKQLGEQGLGEHSIEFIKEGNDLSISLSAEKIEKLLNALMVKRLVKQKVNGEGLIQVANTLMEEMISEEGTDEFTNATKEQLKQYRGTNDLPTYRQGEEPYKATGKEVYVPQNLVSGTEKWGTLQEANQNAKAALGNTPHSIDMIEAGFRTRTTRSKKELDKYNVKVGDIIKNVGKSADGTTKTIYARVTAIHPKGTPGFTDTWGKEGWTAEGVSAIDRFKDGAAAIEFETVSTRKAPTTAMKVKVSLSGDFKKLLGVMHTDGKRIKTMERLNEMIKDEEWLNTGQNRQMITMVGVRIPVQGLNSMEFMEVYEFLPAEAGSIIVPPSEIVTKSGADFDVDKLTVMMPNIAVINGNVELYDTNITASDTKENLEAQRDELRKKRKEIRDKYDDIFDRRDITEEFAFNDKDAAELEALNKESEAIFSDVQQIKAEKKVLYKKHKDRNLKLQVELYKNRLNNAYEKLDDVNMQKGDLIAAAKSAVVQDIVAKQKAELDPINESLIRLQREINSYGKQGIENDLIQNIKDILALPDNFESLVTPNSTNLFTEKGAGKDQSLVEELSPFAAKYVPTKTTHGEAPRRGKVKGVEKDIISPTRSLEVLYNLHKHKTNKTGGDILAIGAVDNTYNTVFNRIGAYMNPDNGKQYLYDKALATKKEDRTDEQNDLIDKFGPQTILLPHNKITEEYSEKEAISLSHIKDAQGNVKISDIVNQFINGAVDVAADPWIFNIQGNVEVAPTLLFLFQAGVPVDYAVYFVSNPLVREYVKEQQLAKSIFANPLGKGSGNPKHFRSSARKVMLSDNKYGINANVDKLTNKNITKYLRDRPKSNTDFTLEEVRTAAKTDSGREYTSREKEMFLHFLELEDMSSSVSNFKRRTNVDTARDTSLYEAQNRLGMIADLKRDGRLMDGMVEKVRETTPIGSFFIQEFQLALIGDMFPSRNHRVINRYAVDKISSQDVDLTYGNKEIAVQNWKSDLISHIFQQELRHIDLKNLTHYRGYQVDTTMPVEKDFINYGAFVKDGVLHVDMNALVKQYENKDYLKAEYYTKFKLAGTDSHAFNNREEYVRFVLEREVLRAAKPLSALMEGSVKDGKLLPTKMKLKVAQIKNKLKQKKDESDEVFNKRVLQGAYEVYLRDEALTKTHNHWHLFKSKHTYAHEFIRIREAYPELAKKFTLVQALSTKASSGYNNLMLNESIPDQDTINVLHENLKDLTKRERVSAVLPEATELELNEITEFFKAFETVAVLQSGLSMKSAFSLTAIISEKGFQKILEEPMKNLSILMNKKPELAEVYLDRFHNQFMEENKASNRFSRTRGKYYSRYPVTLTQSRSIIPLDTTKTEIKKQTATPLFDVQMVPDGQTYSSNIGTQEKAQEFVAENPDKVYVYNLATVNQHNATKGDHVLHNAGPNVFGLPTRLKYTSAQEGYIKDKDGTIDPDVKTAIDTAIKEMQEKADEFDLIFSNDGYGQEMIEKNKAGARFAPETFLYLSQQLYENFGYLNPGFLRSDFGGSGIIQSLRGQAVRDSGIVENKEQLVREVSDEAVRDFMKQCIIK